MATSSHQLAAEVRCPTHPRRLIMRLFRDPESRIDPASNLIEVKCKDCRGVLLRYNLLGELVDTVEV